MAAPSKIAVWNPHVLFFDVVRKTVKSLTVVKDCVNFRLRYTVVFDAAKWQNMVNECVAVTFKLRKTSGVLN